MNTALRIPGTHEPGFHEPRLVEVGDGGTGLRAALTSAGSKGVRFYTMGGCSIILAREPAGADGESCGRPREVVSIHNPAGQQ